jgi:hypothetical protein
VSAMKPPTSPDMRRGLEGEASIRALPFPRTASVKDIDGDALKSRPRSDDLPFEEDGLKSSQSESSSALPMFLAGENGEATGLSG